MSRISRLVNTNGSAVFYVQKAFVKTKKFHLVNENTVQYSIFIKSSLRGSSDLIKIVPPCVTTSRKQPLIQNAKFFPVKALQLEPLENDQTL